MASAQICNTADRSDVSASEAARRARRGLIEGGWGREIGGGRGIDGRESRFINPKQQALCATKVRPLISKVIRAQLRNTKRGYKQQMRFCNVVIRSNAHGKIFRRGTLEIYCVQHVQ